VKVVVEILDGARAGQRLTFDAPRTVRFGRHPDNEVAFDPQVDRDASSRHAELRLALGGYRLFDLGSANGTLASGVRLPQEGLPITTAIEVMFGGPRCRVMVMAPGAEVPATFLRPADSLTPPAATPPAITPPRKFGANTVAGIVDDALRRARGTNRQQAVVIALVIALVASGIGAAAAMFMHRTPEAMKKELAGLVAAQAGASDAERAALQKKIDALSARLSRGVDIPKRSHDALFLVVAHSAASDGFCTAFAVTPRRLLTNAHCVELAEELRRKGAKIELLPNGGGTARAVTAWKKARGFHSSSTRIGTDVGWLEVDDDLPAHLEVAAPAAVHAVAAGDTMSTYGFPGRLADVRAPEATYVTGVIGRVTGLDGRPAAPADAQLLQHSAFTSAGTSGSPLFDAEGRVIGINAGGYLDDGAAGRPLPGYNFGMRIDLALTLLNEADE
jgi:S1-C subfamily serine protease